jgi:hypothetical protein
MGFNDWQNLLPLWGLFLVTLAFCIAGVEAGTALARLALKRKNEKDPDGPLGALVGSLLGLLAFILAFTFGLAAARFDARRQLVQDEANALGTAYLRAGLLPQAQRDEARLLLRQYADVRMNASAENIQWALDESVAIHRRLWSQAESLTREDMDSELRSLFIASLNEVIEVHQSRVTVGLQFRIPGTVWSVVYLLTALSMLAVGYQVGMSGVRRLRGTPVAAAAFSVVILLIADIDRQGEGLIRVSRQPIIEVRQKMREDRATSSNAIPSSPAPSSPAPSSPAPSSPAPSIATPTATAR